MSYRYWLIQLLSSISRNEAPVTQVFSIVLKIGNEQMTRSLFRRWPDTEVKLTDPLNLWTLRTGYQRPRCPRTSQSANAARERFISISVVIHCELHTWPYFHSFGHTLVLAKPAENMCPRYVVFIMSGGFLHPSYKISVRVQPVCRPVSLPFFVGSSDAQREEYGARAWINCLGVGPPEGI